MRVIAVTNQKGGTGKTTTVVNLGFALAQVGSRTLLVDLDAQGNLGVSFGIESDRSLYHILVEGADPNSCTVNVRPNLHLIPSNETTASAELIMTGEPGRETLEFIPIICKCLQNIMNPVLRCKCRKPVCPMASEALSA